MSDSENKDLFDKMRPMHNHFQKALNEDIDYSPVFYDQISDSDKRYVEGSFIDRGGAKSISSFEDSFTAREVAMAKLLDTNDPEKIDRFIKEARLTASLQHPNIMPLYDMGTDAQGDPFFTMKLIKGQSLDELVNALNKKETQLSLQERVQIFIKICDAIAYAHSTGIIHLDLKPANICVGAYGEVLVCDWGIAKITGDPEDMDGACLLDPQVYNDATLNGVVKGSPGYLAPEQIEPSFGDKNETTDVYALGGILYYLLCRRKPIDDNNTMESLKKTLAGAILSPSKREADTDIPESLEAVAMKALSLQQADRYQSVSALLKDLNKWLGGFATQAENAGFAKSLWLLSKRHKEAVTLLFLMFIMAIFAVVEIKINEQNALLHAKRAEDALEKYKEQKEKTLIVGKEAAPRLADLTSEELKKSRYDFEKALELANRAIDRDPNLQQAWVNKAMVHFYRQEFNQSTEAFEHIGINHYRKTKFYSFANEYAKQKSDYKLLSVSDLVELMNKLQHIEASYLLAGYAEQHAFTLDDSIEIAIFMLKLTNRNINDLKIDVVKDDKKLIVNLSQTPRLYSLSALRNLPIKNLNIANTSITISLNITKMPLEELNISHTKIKSGDLKAILNIPTLKKLIISKHQYKGFYFPEGTQIKVIRQ